VVLAFLRSFGSGEVFLDAVATNFITACKSLASPISSVSLIRAAFAVAAIS
jgi:hypothetical protein